MHNASPPRREHRRHARVRHKRLKVRYRSAGLLEALLTPFPLNKATFSDCSEGGMKLLAPKVIGRGERLSMKMEIPFMPRTFTLTGRVTRCREVMTKQGLKRYELGVAIEKAQADYLEMLKRLRQDPLLRQGAI